MWVIESDSRYCKDCYRCLKECPVKAIRFEGGSSRIVWERCILCGHCIPACPQGVKREGSSLAEVRELLGSGQRVVASVDPSFVAYFGDHDYRKIVDLCYKLGFAHVEETAFGAYYTAMAVRRELETSDTFRIGSTCPAAVYLIQKYFPEFIPHLSRADSPPIAHARLIRAHYGGDVKVVHISPCAAKRHEILQHAVRGLVSFHLTFPEMDRWAAEIGVSYENLETRRDFERIAPGSSRLYPVRGGLLKTANLDVDYTSVKHLSITGPKTISTFLKTFRPEYYPTLQFVDFLLCEGGCINGPLGWKSLNPLNRLKVAEYQRLKGGVADYQDFPVDALLTRKYHSLKKEYPEPTEAEVSEILERIDISGPHDELDCGACGYPTCREKAVAVFQGVADPAMCLSYIRKKGEGLGNVVMDNSPNGVVLINRQMKVITCNPAFRKFFGVGELDNITGKSIVEYVADTGPFTEAYNDKTLVFKKMHFPETGLHFRLATFPMEDEHCVVGIFQDRTTEENHRLEVGDLRREIAGRAQEVILRQMRIAQQIAELLGETTAETKAMLSRLVQTLKTDDRHVDA